MVLLLGPLESDNGLISSVHVLDKPRLLLITFTKLDQRLGTSDYSRPGACACDGPRGMPLFGLVFPGFCLLSQAGPGSTAAFGRGRRLLCRFVVAADILVKTARSAVVSARRRFG